MPEFKSIIDMLKEKEESKPTPVFPESVPKSVSTIEELHALHTIIYPKNSEVEVKEDGNTYILVSPIFKKWVKKES